MGAAGQVAEAEPAVDVLALHEALSRLAELDPRQAELVELRYFGGLTIEETAHVLGIAAITVRREWVTAQTWLKRELAEPGAPGAR